MNYVINGMSYSREGFLAWLFITDEALTVVELISGFIQQGEGGRPNTRR